MARKMFIVMKSLTCRHRLAVAALVFALVLVIINLSLALKVARTGQELDGLERKGMEQSGTAGWTETQRSVLDVR